MALFGKKNKKSLFDKSRNRAEVKKKRRVFGKADIAEKANPYNNKPNFFNKFRKKKRQYKTQSSSLVAPPSRLSHSKPSRLKRILLVLLIVFIVGGLTYFSFFTNYFEINQYHIYEDGTQITNNLMLNEVTRKALLSQNLLLFNDSKLTEEILQKAPEYQKITVKKVLPHTIEIGLTKYPVAANITNLISGTDGMRIQKKYMVNTNGMVIMENEENPDLPYITITTPQAIGLNAFPLDQEKLDYIIKLTNLFEEKFGIKVIEAQYMKSAREVHLRTEKDFSVWFDLTKDMLPQIDKLKRALPKLDIYKTPLQYIDLRISGTNAEKVIFKRRK